MDTYFILVTYILITHFPSSRVSMSFIIIPFSKEIIEIQHERFSTFDLLREELLSNWKNSTCIACSILRMHGAPSPRAASDTQNVCLEKFNLERISRYQMFFSTIQGEFFGCGMKSMFPCLFSSNQFFILKNTLESLLRILRRI